MLGVLKEILDAAEKVDARVSRVDSSAVKALRQRVESAF